ncbi:flagellar M-ring protein FliF [Pseudidiomarina salinarum]|uniref:Flagellar M-ring protein n=1 Tax=Pseudidiomarina salinarum TaxID=435908 RepID=A0A094L824_9GAMM|nr:flagellar basal-body MS-ring/collar protein FliF [Pseudidiomarina salinarum]KFZ30933.1 flagellar M-ring protein FliF [Pseudidiomarina salinarum]RUO71420.1 flagellar basal body M-ring protein FliF [Pseudidiomarina salinarum]
MEATQTVKPSATAAPAAAGTPQWLQQLKTNNLVPLLIGGAAFVGLVFALIMWASTPEYRVLYSNLSEADGGRIVTELETQQVPYQLNGAGTIMVPGDQVHRLRLRMAEQGLPQGGNAGFSLMDNQAFGISQFAEQVNFQRALEGELSSSMESLGPVARARVHLAMAKASVFVRDREPAKASVILTLHAGRKLGDGQVQAIIHMVSSSVPELSTEQVTVVDQYGNLLSRNNREDALSGTKLTYIEQIERSYQERIENILTPILGRTNIQAQVVAHVDFAKREATAESYTPNQNIDTAAIRSIQRNTTMQGNGMGARGVPGALTNTPPGVEASPIEMTAAEPGDEPAVETAENNAGNRSVQQDQIVNYEVNRTIEHVDHHRGQLERLSVAVVVNHREVIGEDGIATRVKRSEEELEYINRLVRQAMGFTEARGDQLDVINSLFINQVEPVEELSWWQQQGVQQLVMSVVRYLLAGLGILLLYLFLLRPLLNRFTSSSGPARSRPRGNLRAVVGDDDDDDLEQARPRSAPRAGATGDDDDEEEAGSFRWPEKENKSNYKKGLKKAQEQARDNPKQVARILQNWINSDDHV